LFSRLISALGVSEIRGANGALFAGVGLAIVFISLPLGFAMVGFMYAGAAIGRPASIILDGPGQLTGWRFLVAEVILAVFLIAANLGSFQ
jgi:hypothetical protein